MATKPKENEQEKVLLKCLQSMAGTTVSYVPGQVYGFAPEEAEKFNDGVRFIAVK